MVKSHYQTRKVQFQKTELMNQTFCCHYSLHQGHIGKWVSYSQPQMFLPQIDRESGIFSTLTWTHSQDSVSCFLVPCLHTSIYHFALIQTEPSFIVPAEFCLENSSSTTDAAPIIYICVSWGAVVAPSIHSIHHAKEQVCDLFLCVSVKFPFPVLVFESYPRLVE